MAKRPTLTDLTSLTNSSAINTLSQNWDAIQEAFDNTLSLDGSTPNAMEADFDLNGNALLNVGTIDVTNLTLDGQTVTDLATVPEWRSSWLTATSYAKNDLVKTNGNVYICLIAHTSGTFATDLTDLKWELMVSKGDSGAGAGDLVSTNNLSDLTNAATARSNLSLGTVATENTVPITKGGTGATTASDARTNLGLGVLATAASITTSEIAAATLVTAADTIATNDNDTTIPTCAAVIDYVAASAPAPSTSDVLSAYAGATAGGIGTYVFARRTSGSGDIAFGSNLAGSSLSPTSALCGAGDFGSSGDLSFNSGSALSGTWKCMGTYDHRAATTGTVGGDGATLWMRIS